MEARKGQRNKGRSNQFTEQFYSKLVENRTNISPKIQGGKNRIESAELVSKLQHAHILERIALSFTLWEEFIPNSHTCIHVI